MTKVSFYILEQSGIPAREQMACRLCEKAYKQGMSVHISTADEAQTARLDDLLWSFRAGSFVPHSSDITNQAAIWLGHQAPPHDAPHQLMIQLNHNIPDWFSRYERVLEIVANDPEQKQSSRTRYGFYRDRGYTLETHNIAA